MPAKTLGEANILIRSEMQLTCKDIFGISRLSFEETIKANFNGFTTLLKIYKKSELLVKMKLKMTIVIFFKCNIAVFIINDLSVLIII